MAISKGVWGRGWRQEAAKTQAAAREIGSFIQWLEQEGHSDIADTVRRASMQQGVRQAVAKLKRVFLVEQKRLAVKDWQRRDFRERHPWWS